MAGVLDLRELFSEHRACWLRGIVPLHPPSQIVEVSKAETRDGQIWWRFADPVGTMVLHRRVQKAEALLAAGGSPLEECHREAAATRAALSNCRSELEGHCTATTVILELLATNSIDPGLLSAQAPQPRCVGHRRCFFCRERLALETSGLREEMTFGADSGGLADVSSCDEFEGCAFEQVLVPRHRQLQQEPLMLRRRTSLQRGEAVYRFRTPVPQPPPAKTGNLVCEEHRRTSSQNMFRKSHW